MYNGFVHLHNLLRWVIIILLLIVIIRHLTGMLGRKPFLPKDKRLSLILTTTVHIQFLIGLYQWIFGNFGFRLIKAAGGMGEVMKNAAMRFGPRAITTARWTTSSSRRRTIIAVWWA